MFAGLLSKFNPTPDRFQSEIIQTDFQEEILLSLLDSGIDINYCDENGDTFLSICIKKHKLKAVEWLLKHKCNPNVRNNDGQTPIQLAVKSGKVKITKVLLETGLVSSNEKDGDGRTLLHEAVINGEIEIVNELIKHSADINIVDKNNRNILFDAVAYGEDKLISKILATGALDINTVDSEGHTILHKQEVLSDDNLAKKLLHHGADPTITDNDGKNFLFHTALRGEDGEELLDLAVEKGCSLNGRVRNNNSILMEIMFAFTNLSEDEKKRRAGLMSMAKKLVKKGINVNAINDQGETVLFDAVRKNDTEATAFLLDDGVDVNQRNKRFETALSISVLKGIKALDIILLLMDYGASIITKVKDLKTILEVLNDIILHTHGNHDMENQNLLVQVDIEKGKYLVVLRDILSKTNVQLDYKDFSGDPIYFKPLLYGNIDLFRLYVKYGIDINKRNSKGKTLFQEYVMRIFDLGVFNENFEEVLLLLSSVKVNVNAQMPGDGKTILSYVVSQKRCSIELFKILIKRTRFNYTLQDKFGRTVIHSCVMGSNVDILRILYAYHQDIINIPDFYGMLPLTYIALSGNSELLLELINLDSLVTTDKKLTEQAITKFSPLLPNLDKLTNKVYDLDDLRKINIVIDQIKKEFRIG